MAQLDRAVKDADDGVWLGDSGEGLRDVGQRLGAGHVGGHRLGVVPAVRHLLERGRNEREQRPVLHRADPARREGPAVRERLDDVMDVVGVGTRQQEGGVGRVQQPPASGGIGDHGAPGRDNRLGEQLPAEGPLVALLLAGPAEHPSRLLATSDLGGQALGGQALGGQALSG